MRKLLAAIAVASLLLIPAIANAADPFLEVNDPNDSPGRLDFEHLKGLKTSSASDLEITMKFRNAFQAKLLKRSGPNRVFVYFDSDDDRKTEYTGKIFKTSRLVMATSGQGSHFERLPVTKPNATTLKVTVPAGAPFNPNGPMRIAAKSFYSGTVCPTKCTDRVPSQGWVRV